MGETLGTLLLDSDSIMHLTQASRRVGSYRILVQLFGKSVDRVMS